jgi:hypothetical protein
MKIISKKKPGVHYETKLIKHLSFGGIKFRETLKEVMTRKRGVMLRHKLVLSLSKGSMRAKASAPCL